jgi:high-affinity nickel-transport protein
MFRKIIQHKVNVKSVIILGGLSVITSIVWIVSVIIYQSYMSNNIYLLVLSYLLGLKHALDADHIAAIDNVTNKLILTGQQPVTVGLYFSLGHSTIVIIVSILLAILTDTINNNINTYNENSDLIGPIISASFLLCIGCINVISIYMIYKNLMKVKNIYKNNEEEKEEKEEKEENNEIVNWNEIYQKNGCFSYCFGNTLFKMIDKPWKMYFVGFLFGLGFDTATEIALLGIITIQSTNDVSSWIIMPLPLLFTCGMSLIDTIDGIIMTNIYGWGFINPIKKIYYNLTITSISCTFALFIGFIQLLGIIQPFYSDDNTTNTFWQFIILSGDKENFLIIGISLVGSFIIGFLLSFAIFKYGNFQSTIEMIDKEKTNNIQENANANVILDV